MSGADGSTRTVLVIDRDARWFCDALADCPGYRFVPSAGGVPSAGRHAQVLVGLAPAITAAVVDELPHLAWVHALTTGVDNLLALPNLGRDVALTNSRGVHGPQMSEMALMLMMACVRRLPAMLRHQAEGRWERWPQPLLLGKTVCIVGLGAIAEALAERCLAFGMRVTGVSDARTQVPGFARLYRREALQDAAAEADFLVVVVPYGASTRHLVDAAVLQCMKPSAVLVNLARGGCVDEAALARHLRDGRLAAAACDVFQTEPLPPDDPLWQLPNLIVTPHVGGQSDVYAQQLLPLLRRNLVGYAEAGRRALENLVPR
jgi:phosphoglycerate dehydrogenase-like enzyme